MEKKDRSASLSSKPLFVGMAVEARYGGKCKWYKATITKVNRSSRGDPERWKYNLLYMDGDREELVKRHLIRLSQPRIDIGNRPSSSYVDSGEEFFASTCSSSSGTEGDERLRVGTEIEARYGGKSKWYRGTVSRVRRGNQSPFANPERYVYDVVYDDGDREVRVKRSLIRVLQHPVTESEISESELSSSVSSTPIIPLKEGINGGNDSTAVRNARLAVGDKVEASFVIVCTRARKCR